MHCLSGFRNTYTLEKHKELCRKNLLATTLYTLPKDNMLEFKDYSKTVTPPFTLYADFEAILPTDTKYHQIQKPIAAGCIFLNNYTGENEYEVFTGEDCVKSFLEYIDIIIETKILPFIKEEMNTPMEKLNSHRFMEFRRTRVCYLCNKEKKPFGLVRDHCHYTGKYLGAACPRCNLSTGNT